MTQRESRTIQAIMGDPPMRHLAAIPDEYDLRHEAPKTDRIVDEESAAVIDRMIERNQRGPVPPSLPKQETVNMGDTKTSRRWIMPGRRAYRRTPTVSFRSTGDLCLSRVVREALGGDDPEERLFVGVALMDDGTLVIERCRPSDSWSRPVHRDTGIVHGGGAIEQELRAAGFEPGTVYPVDLNSETGVVVVKRSE